jgi:hypothetical protein
MGGWRVVVYPEAGEAGGVFRSAAESDRRPSVGVAPTPEQNAADAGRRARGQVRRYCAANGLNRLGTLTYGPEGLYDPKAVRDDVGIFFRRLRGELGERIPYLWVPEWHPGGHGLHVHFAVARYIDRRSLLASWSHGFVHITLLGDLPSGSGVRGEARRTGRYLAKYVAKDASSGGQPAGLHRYEVAQGFQPREVAIEEPTETAALEHACQLMGSLPEYVWRSRDQEDWDKPPAIFASWP